MKFKREYRFISELRADQGDEMALVGYAALFNHESKDLGGFREIIAPGAFARSLQEADSDVKCLFNHDSNQILGRTKSGSLTLATDDRGLKFRCLINKEDPEAMALYARVKRGDIDECSFAFTVAKGGQSWNESAPIVRTLTDVNLLDVSAVTYPAYNGTSVGARSLFPDGCPAEVRSALKRSLEDDDCYEDIIREISAALAERYPATYENGEVVPCGYGLYWVCETYGDYVIAAQNGPGDDYFLIPYHTDDTDETKILFGDPQPVEKEWVPAERCKTFVAERRTHFDALIAAHKEAAADAGAQADAHTAAAAALEKAAAKKQRCMDSDGDCDDPECDCQNVMADESDDEARSQGRAGIKNKVRTKSVGGKSLPAKDFAYVGDPDKTETWKLPIHDADHVRNALARFNQTEGIPAEKKAGVYRKIKSAAKKFGIDVSDDDSKRALENCPMDEEEIWEKNARLRLAVNQ